MSIKPFLKWAGGKRWLLKRPEFQLPEYSGTYIEPFIGGGAVFFAHRPVKSIISDSNSKLIETYSALKGAWKDVIYHLEYHQRNHSTEHYYFTRSAKYDSISERAAQFLYLNRACWNGLYRENLRGEFNVPIGTKSTIIFENDDFEQISLALGKTKILNKDFEEVVSLAKCGDLLFVDPPYTVAHNFNGFVKYNQKIFSWDDQVRLRDSLKNAKRRGVRIVVTNAAHQSIRELYQDLADPIEIQRSSIISGNPQNRNLTSELLYVV